MKNNLKGHYRSQKVIWKFQNRLFLRYIFCLTPNLLKTFQECQYYEDSIFLIKWSMTLKVIPYKKPLCQNHARTFIYGSILMKTWKHNIFILCYGEDLWFFPLSLLTFLQHWLTFLWTTFILVLVRE